MLTGAVYPPEWFLHACDAGTLRNSESPPDSHARAVAWAVPFFLWGRLAAPAPRFGQVSPGFCRRASNEVLPLRRAVSEASCLLPLPCIPLGAYSLPHFSGFRLARVTFVRVKAHSLYRSLQGRRAIGGASVPQYSIRDRAGQ